MQRKDDDGCQACGHDVLLAGGFIWGLVGLAVVLPGLRVGPFIASLC